MQLFIQQADRRDIVARACRAAIASTGDTLEAGLEELQAQYRLQLATYVPLAQKRVAVAGLINSSLPSEMQDQISDTAVTTVFADLVRTGLLELEVEWTVPPAPEPPKPPEPPPPIAPFNPFPGDLWPTPPPLYNFDPYVPTSLPIADEEDTEP